MFFYSLFSIFSIPTRILFEEKIPNLNKKKNEYDCLNLFNSQVKRRKDMRHWQCEQQSLFVNPMQLNVN